MNRATTTMYKQTVSPLAINTTVNGNGNPNVITATFRYTEEPVNATTARRRASVNHRSTSRQTSVEHTSPRTGRSPHPSAMNGYPGSTASPPGMYVKALYDYNADDQTSLSFRKGDIIQVLNQLETGWWDGIMNDIRGWFPSNYCAVVTGPGEGTFESQGIGNKDETSSESGNEEEDVLDIDSDSNVSD